MTGNLIFAENDFITGAQALKYPEPVNSVYEVIRIIDGMPLFFEDHFARLQKSCQTFGFKVHISNEIKHIIKLIVKKNNIDYGNLKIEYKFFPSEIKLFVYQLNHTYPSDEMYRNGVKLKTFKTERPNPNVKQSIINNKIRDLTDKLLGPASVFEVVLINANDEVTEGSRSNIFFVKDNALFSAPGDQILKGITRAKVIHIARLLNLDVIEKPIHLSELGTFTGCFLTGTSPKVLPVNTLDNYIYSAENEHIMQIVQYYDNMINEYHCQFKWE